jgi:hypothetical protein
MRMNCTPCGMVRIAILSGHEATDKSMDRYSP